MDAIIIILIILILVLLFKRTFSSAIYAVVIVDIFLRLVDFIRGSIEVKGEIGKIFATIPSSLNDVIIRNTNGLPILQIILLWLIFVVYLIFEYYIFAHFLRKR